MLWSSRSRNWLQDFGFLVPSTPSSGSTAGVLEILNPTVATNCFHLEARPRKMDPSSGCPLVCPKPRSKAEYPQLNPPPRVLPTMTCIHFFETWFEASRTGHAIDGLPRPPIKESSRASQVNAAVVVRIQTRDMGVVWDSRKR